jgi:hypothetical protein
MSVASRCVKGSFFDAESEEWRPVTISQNGRGVVQVVMPPPGTSCFLLPFYKPSKRFVAGLMDESSMDREIHTASLIYMYGSIRLGGEKCNRCRSHGSRRETEDGVIQHCSPIPACVQAPGFCHGVCACCFLEGGDLNEMVNRCSVATLSSFSEYHEVLDASLSGLRIFGGETEGVFLSRGGEEDVEERFYTELLF